MDEAVGLDAVASAGVGGDNLLTPSLFLSLWRHLHGMERGDSARGLLLFPFMVPAGIIPRYPIEHDYNYDVDSIQDIKLVNFSESQQPRFRTGHRFSIIHYTPPMSHYSLSGKWSPSVGTSFCRNRRTKVHFWWSIFSHRSCTRRGQLTERARPWAIHMALALNEVGNNRNRENKDLSKDVHSKSMTS